MFQMLFMDGQPLGTDYIHFPVTILHSSERNVHDKTRVQFVDTTILIRCNDSSDAVIWNTTMKVSNGAMNCDTLPHDENSIFGIDSTS